MLKSLKSSLVPAVLIVAVILAVAGLLKEAPLSLSGQEAPRTDDLYQEPEEPGVQGPDPRSDDLAHSPATRERVLNIGLYLDVEGLPSGIDGEEKPANVGPPMNVDDEPSGHVSAGSAEIRYLGALLDVEDEHLQGSDTVMTIKDVGPRIDPEKAN